MQALGTSDYRGQPWPSQEDEEEGYPLYVFLLFRVGISADLLRYAIYSPLVMKVRSRASSVISGASTPGGGRSNTLSEGDLRKADAALSHVNETQTNGVNGH